FAEKQSYAGTQRKDAGAGGALARKWFDPEAVLQSGRDHPKQVQLLGGQRTGTIIGRICRTGGRQPFGPGRDHLSQWGQTASSCRYVATFPVDPPVLMFSLGSSHRYFLYRDACDGTHEITLGYRFGE